MKPFPVRPHAALLILSLLASGTSALAQSGPARTYTLAAESLALQNLIGEIRIEPAAGEVFEVAVSIRGEDATPERIRVEVAEGRRARLAIRFPLDETHRFVYPDLPGGGHARFSLPGEKSGWGLRDLLHLGRSRQVEVRSSGRGLELWADVTVRVPRDAELIVRHGAGEIRAADTSGDLDLDISVGGIAAENHAGSLRADTGSGRIAVSGASGDLHLDTGSGEVRIERCRGDEVWIDTGSGGVTARGVRTSHLRIDTGSGRVAARSVEADEARIDTGSGSVDLELTRMGTGRFVIDTGSGRVDLRLPRDASARVTADTGNGGIDLDLEDARIRSREHDHMVFDLGDAEARLRIDTGNGSIRIRQ